MYTSSHMEGLISALPYIQIVLAVLLTGVILMQQRGAGLGSAFGGGDGTVHYERRGFEKTLFQVTIILAVTFVMSAALPIFLNNKDHTYVPIEVNTAQGESTTTTNILEGIEITTEGGETVNTEPVNTLGIPTE